MVPSASPSPLSPAHTTCCECRKATPRQMSSATCAPSVPHRSCNRRGQKGSGRINPILVTERRQAHAGAEQAQRQRHLQAEALPQRLPGACAAPTASRPPCRAQTQSADKGAHGIAAGRGGRRPATEYTQTRSQPNRHNHSKPRPVAPTPCSVTRLGWRLAQRRSSRTSRRAAVSSSGLRVPRGCGVRACCHALGAAGPRTAHDSALTAVQVQRQDETTTGLTSCATPSPPPPPPPPASQGRPAQRMARRIRHSTRSALARHAAPTHRRTLASCPPSLTMERLVRPSMSGWPSCCGSTRAPVSISGSASPSQSSPAAARLPPLCFQLPFLPPSSARRSTLLCSCASSMACTTAPARRPPARALAGTPKGPERRDEIDDLPLLGAREPKVSRCAAA